MISIVIPAYNEEKTLYKNINEIVKYVKNEDYEFVLVDDGSKDGTWKVINTLHSENNRIKGIKFSKNYGKELALCAGIKIAGGNPVITMDSDLQHPPENIPEMISKWREGYRIVECVKSSRGKESFLYKLCAKSFYNTLKSYTNFDLRTSTDFKLLDRQVVNRLNNIKRKNAFFRGMVEEVGFNKYQMECKISDRQGDTSKFSKKALARLALNAITGYSDKPLYHAFEFGIIFLFVTLFLFVYVLVCKDNLNIPTLKIILLQFFLGAIICFNLGIIGLYLSKIFAEVKDEPRYIISERIV